MASKFGWIDFSEKERQQMLDIIDLFNKQDTRDELGVGTIRDAFSDHFFPGTSTIQTRARYFLFVPWIYRDVERRLAWNKWSAERFSREIEICEKKLIRALMAGGEKEGVIGIEAKEKLQRLPSNIYWTGLYALKIRRVEGSQSQYARQVSYCHRTPRAEASGMNPRSKEHDEPTLENSSSGWHLGMPDPPINLLKETTLKLTRKQAAYLRERVIQAHRNSLFASFLLETDDTLGTNFVWEHPIIPSLPKILQNSVLHARNFSEAIHGAALLYNLMLSEAKENEEGTSKYISWLDQWALELSQRWSVIEKWCQNRGEFWQGPVFDGHRIPVKTKRFVDNWLSTLLENGGPKNIYENRDARMWISHRELELKKKSRARLHNDDALSRWSGASGTAQLDFRWRIAKAHLTDIYTGLNGREGTNA
jgi:hypothetical protein